MPASRLLATALSFLIFSSCSRTTTSPSDAGAATAAPRVPSILLVTLDTTRVDALTPGVAPRWTALLEKGHSFRAAYATAPMTLPSHASMLTGLYPAGHGVHENARPLSRTIPVVTERLAALGYDTAAFVSGFPLDAQFGLDRGFSRYDDEFPAGSDERSARDTTDRALTWMSGSGGGRTVTARPVFLWVHYYDPHDPYEPAASVAARFASDTLGRYHAEVSAMDVELGRLVEAFESAYDAAGSSAAVAIVADHGEGLGDHGEALHGTLLYEGVMRVPLLLRGPGVTPGESRRAVSVRQIAPTLLDWATGDAEESGTEGSLLSARLNPAETPPVLAEAMQPFLNYRWQPQVMAVDTSGRWKAIQAGRLEIYDLQADPAEAHDLAAATPLERNLRQALRDYPLPGAGNRSAPAAPLDEETRRKLESLGYISSTSDTPAIVPPGAPRPREMTHLLADLDEGSRLFSQGAYRQALPVFASVAGRDPENPMVAVRLGVIHSFLGNDKEALRAFEQASRIDPESSEARHYLALHHERFRRYDLAERLFEQVVARQPHRRLALERLGLLRMRRGDTSAAIEALERAQNLAGDSFEYDLELGVLLLAARRVEEARDAFDRVKPGGPAHAMALFKRAQVAALLAEADTPERIRLAWEAGTRETRAMIAAERLFGGYNWR